MKFSQNPVRVLVINTRTRFSPEGLGLAYEYGEDKVAAKPEVTAALTARGFTVLPSHHPHVLVARRDGVEFNVILRQGRDDVRAFELASHGDLPLTELDVWVIERSARRAFYEGKVGGSLRRQFLRQLRQRTLSGVWAKRIALAAVTGMIKLSSDEDRPGVYERVQHQQHQVEAKLLRATVPGEEVQLELPDVLIARLTELQGRVPSARADAVTKLAALEGLSQRNEGDVGVPTLFRGAIHAATALDTLNGQVYSAYTTAHTYDATATAILTEGMAETDGLYTRIEAALVAMHGRRALPWDPDPLRLSDVQLIKDRHIRISDTFVANAAPFCEEEEPVEDGWPDGDGTELVLAGNEPGISDEVMQTGDGLPESESE